MTTIITIPGDVAYEVDTFEEAVERYLGEYDPEDREYDPFADPGFRQLKKSQLPDIEELDAEYLVKRFDAETTESGCDTWLETYGTDLEIVLATDSRSIWTIVSCDDGVMRLSPGYHLVNRMGYIITEKEWQESDLNREWAW